MPRIRGLRVLPLAALATLGCLVAPTAASAGPATPAGRPPELGAYAAGYPGAGSQLSQFERRLGSRVGVASSYRGWGDIFPDASQLADARTGHTLLVAWDLGATRATRFATFPAHEHDAYLAQEAAAARRYGRPLYVRPWPEMNGDWTAYQPTRTGDRPAGGTYAEFRAAWRYLVRFFRSHGATNVRWIFNPTTDTYAQTTPIGRIWPGRAYVDVLGLDGYNWGRGGVFAWHSFRHIYHTQFHRLVRLAPGKPVWICEVGSKEPRENDGAPRDPNHSKATWYRNMFRWVSAHRRVRAVVLFDVRKERDWRVESERGALSTVDTAARADLRRAH